MRDLGLLSYYPVSSIFSHPVTQVLSTDFHLRAETYTKLCSVWQCCLPGKMRVTPSVSDWHRSTCAHHYCRPSPLRGSYKPLAGQNPWLSLAGVDSRMGSLCSASASVVMTVDYCVAWGDLNPANGTSSCKTCLLAVRFGCR